MTTFLKTAAEKMARCRRCDHDLLVGSDGRVYCTNSHCKHARDPHPTGNALNYKRR